MRAEFAGGWPHGAGPGEGAEAAGDQEEGVADVELEGSAGVEQKARVLAAHVDEHVHELGLVDGIGHPQRVHVGLDRGKAREPAHGRVHEFAHRQRPHTTIFRQRNCHYQCLSP